MWDRFEEGEVDEHLLVERLKAGDQSAFSSLVEGCRERTWAVCYRITGNTHDAEDALQDAIVAAWRHVDRFRGDARFSTWLHRIAANASLSIVRRRQEAPTDGIDLGADDRPGFSERIVDRDRVQRALEKIPEDFRTALVLREWGGLSYDEIAQHQGIPVQTVKSRLNRGRRAMAALLGPMG